MRRSSDKSSGLSIKGHVTEVIKLTFGSHTTVGYSQQKFQVTLKEMAPRNEAEARAIAERVVGTLVAADIRGYFGEKLGHRLDSVRTTRKGDVVMLIETIFPVHEED